MLCALHQVRIDEVEDLCQDIVLSLTEDNYRRLRSFDPLKSSFQTWLSAVVKHQIINVKTRRKQVLSLEDLSYEPENHRSFAIEEKVLLSELVEILRAGLTRLTVRERQLLELLCSEEASAIQVATIMGVKVDSVYRRKHDIITKLRKIVNREMVKT